MYNWNMIKFLCQSIWVEISTSRGRCHFYKWFFHLNLICNLLKLIDQYFLIVYKFYGVEIKYEHKAKCEFRFSIFKSLTYLVHSCHTLKEVSTIKYILTLKYTHTHTHTHTYIYIYMLSIFLFLSFSSFWLEIFVIKQM